MSRSQDVGRQLNELRINRSKLNYERDLAARRKMSANALSSLLGAFRYGYLFLVVMAICGANWAMSPDYANAHG